MNCVITLLLLVLGSCSPEQENIYSHSISSEKHIKFTEMLARSNISIGKEGQVSPNLLKEINSKVNNQLTYIADLDDYWQTPQETIKTKQGDCEDYSIYKMMLLHQAGVSMKDMYIVVGFTKEKIAHAVLKVITPSKIYYLDNKDNFIESSTIKKVLYEINPIEWRIYKEPN